MIYFSESMNWKHQLLRSTAATVFCSLNSTAWTTHLKLWLHLPSLNARTVKAEARLFVVRCNYTVVMCSLFFDSIKTEHIGIIVILILILIWKSEIEVLPTYSFKYIHTCRWYVCYLVFSINVSRLSHGYIFTIQSMHPVSNWNIPRWNWTNVL